MKLEIEEIVIFVLGVARGPIEDITCLLSGIRQASQVNKVLGLPVRLLFM